MTNNMSGTDVITINEEEDRRVTRSDGSHGNYHSALLLVFLLGTLGIALAFVPCLVLPSYNPSAFATQVTKFTTIVGGIFALSVATTSLCLIIGKRMLVSKGYVEFSSGNHMERHGTDDNGQPNVHQPSSRLCKSVHRFQIVLFGVGGGTYVIIGLVKVIYSQITFEVIAEKVDCAINLISLVTQMIFFIMYEGALLQNITLLHYAIALMIADKVWVWVALTFGSVADIVQQPNLFEPTSNSTYILHKMLETSQNFLEPFFIEFLTTGVGILFCMWSSMGKKGQNRAGGDPESDDEISPHSDYGSIVITESQERRPLVNEGDTESERDWVSSRDSELQDTSSMLVPKLTKRIGTLALVIASTGYLIAGLILRDGPPLEYITDSIPTFDRITILFAITGVLYGPLTILSAISAYKIYKNISHPPASLSPNAYLLLVTTAGVFLWLLFKLIAAIAVLSPKHQKLNVTDYDAISDIVVHTLCMVHIWVQTQFLLGAHSVHRLRYSASKLTKVCLISLAAINGSEWLQLGLERHILLHHYSSLTPALNAVYGDVGTRILIFVLYPMMELYRFHSVVMAYEILI
ncbi:uncharacterized protein [Amphiura filiformis]|uniref:uncharacterized protein n=1 Tax=Amphiura filiformis TaxID=82378 RepID=UPI003B2203E9